MTTLQIGSILLLAGIFIFIICPLSSDEWPEKSYSMKILNGFVCMMGTALAVCIILGAFLFTMSLVYFATGGTF